MIVGMAKQRDGNSTDLVLFQESVEGDFSGDSDITYGVGRDKQDRIWFTKHLGATDKLFGIYQDGELSRLIIPAKLILRSIRWFPTGRGIFLFPPFAFLLRS